MSRRIVEFLLFEEEIDIPVEEQSRGGSSSHQVASDE
jgi:hypothetical protein